MRIEQKILSTLLFDEEYTKKVIPFLKRDYFDSQSEALIFATIDDFVQKYGKSPSKDAIAIEIDSLTGIPEGVHAEAREWLKELSYTKEETEWLAVKTEEFCQDKAIYQGIMKSIGILEGTDKNLDKGSIPQILSEALAVSFDDHIGHDFIENFDERYEFYHKTEERLKFDLEMLNKITKGGLTRKTLNVILAGTGVGKSLAMCHMAAANLLDGKNVLYITLEMAEERIAERIDANLLNVDIAELEKLSKEAFSTKIDKLRMKTVGKLIIKEYPTASVNVAHFRHLLNELYLKKNFKPDIIYIDYINICSSSRLKNAKDVNSYTYVKAIAEEMRGLAVEKNVPIVSATQINRAGFTNSDPGLEDTSESWGLPATVDLMFALVTNDSLEALGQIMVKQLKNRYNDAVSWKRFVIGIDRSKMRLYNVETTAQGSMVQGTTTDLGPEIGQRPKKKDFGNLFGD